MRKVHKGKPTYKRWMDNDMYEGYTWICDGCGREFVSRDEALNHWEKEHRVPAVKMDDGGLRYIFMDIAKPGWGCSCAHCDRLIKTWGIFADRTTGETVMLCNDCSDLLTCDTLAVHVSKKKRNDGFEAWKKKDSLKKEEFARDNADVISWLKEKVESDRSNYEGWVADYFADDGARRGLRKPVFTGEFYVSLLNQLETRGTLSDKQVEIIKENMGRNTEVTYEVGEKITVVGQTLGYFFKEDQYSQYAVITFRTKDKIDFVLKVGSTTKIKKDLGICIDAERQIVLGVPEKISVAGTVKWIADSGKVYLTRCKLSKAVS